MLFAIIVVLFLIVCVFLIMLVLIQSDKGGGLSGALGGGGLSSASSMLGTQDTANILTRATTISATLFMVFCVAIFLMVAKTDEKQQKSALKTRAENQQNYNPSSVLGNGSLPLSQPMPGNQPDAQQAPAGTQPGAVQSIPLQEALPAPAPAK